MSKYDTIIVGGGMAGLTATAYLARAGQKVLLIEKNKELGGLVNSFTRNGFRFDAGVRALEDAGIIFPMLKDLGIELEVVKSHVSLGIEDQILHIENPDSLEAYRNLLTNFYPESSLEIDQLLKLIRKVMKDMDVLYGIENPIFMDIKHDRDYFFKKLLPWLPRFLLTIGKINRMQLMVEDLLSSVLQNPSLRDIIAQHFFTNTPSFFALSYFSLYLDYFYPKGGVGKLAEVLQNKILEMGGEIKTESKVTKVSPAQKTVRDQQNTGYKYQNLIWAADLKTLYRITDPQGLPLKYKNRFAAEQTKLLSHQGGESVFSLFLEVDEPLESFAKIAHGHFFYTPSRQGLGQTHRGELDLLLQNFAQLSRVEILNWLDKFIALNTFEISIPGLKDADAVPPGQTGLIISVLAKYELFRKVEEAGWLEEFVSGFEERILRVISDSVYPVLKTKLLAKWSFTPLSIHNRIASSEGAIVGWAFQNKMPVINQIQSGAKSILTPLPFIYQAGQWAYSPAGVPMSILTGKFAADKIGHGKARKKRIERKKE